MPTQIELKRFAENKQDEFDYKDERLLNFALTSEGRLKCLISPKQTKPKSAQDLLEEC